MALIHSARLESLSVQAPLCDIGRNGDTHRLFALVPYMSGREELALPAPMVDVVVELDRAADPSRI